MANKVYSARETTLTFKDSGGDAVITLNDLGFGVGRVSAEYNRGTGSKALWHTVRFVVQAKTTGFVAGEAMELYLFESDGTVRDGTLGSGDGAMTSDKRRNGMFIGALIADTTSAATDIVATFKNVPIALQYFQIGVWNGSAARNFNNSANVSYIQVIPQPDEIQ